MKCRTPSSGLHHGEAAAEAENEDQYGTDGDPCQRNTVKRYPELDAYDDDGRTDLSRKPDNVPEDELGLYEIIFKADNRRYYCFVNAINVNEALGQFFRAHPNMTYNNIIEHLEA